MKLKNSQRNCRFILSVIWLSLTAEKSMFLTPSCLSLANWEGKEPHFTGITERSTPAGGSYFHMLQVRFEKRFSDGVQLAHKEVVSPVGSARLVR